MRRSYRREPCISREKRVGRKMDIHKKVFIRGNINGAHAKLHDALNLVMSVCYTTKCVGDDKEEIRIHEAALQCAHDIARVMFSTSAI